jgi:2-polyprenyl-3-methyl-5-hydroxy-6-metoxy-1,4-benzoquinol methylase
MKSPTSRLVSFDYAGTKSSCTGAYLLPVVRDFIQSLPSESRVVDLGCGNGSTLKAVLRPDISAYGVDASVSGIGIATELLPEVSFYLGDITAQLPDQIETGVFNAVISTETIEHVSNPRGLVTNAFNLLRPGGSLLISTPYNGYLKNLVLSLTNKMDSHFTALWDGGHIKFWSRATLSSLLVEAGFESLSFRGAGRAPFLWKSMIIVAKKPL